MTCPGGGLDISCFGLSGACPDYSSCVLTMKGLLVNSSNPMVIPAIQLGMDVNDQGRGIANFGLYPSNVINTFSVYANGTFNVATLNTPMSFTSYNAGINMIVAGTTSSQMQLVSSGQVVIQPVMGASIYAVTGPINLQAGGTLLTVDYATNSILGSSALTSFTTSNFQVWKSLAVPWFQTQSTISLTCAPVGPFPDISSSSFLFSTDVILAAGTRLLSNNTNGRITMGSIQMCGGGIFSSGTSIQIQESTASKTLDIWAVITNSDPGQPVTIIDNQGLDIRAAITNLETSQPVIFSDPQGVDFQSTPLFDSTGGYLQVTDAQGLQIVSPGCLRTSCINSLTSAVAVAGDITFTHAYSNTGVPGNSAGTGAGNSPTFTFTGSDCRMQLSLTTGTSPAGAGATIFSVTFASPFPSTPVVLFSPLNANAAALTGAGAPYVSPLSTSSFNFVAGTTSLTASTTYVWGFSAC